MNEYWWNKLNEFIIPEFQENSFVLFHYNMETSKYGLLVVSIQSRFNTSWLSRGVK